MARPAGPRGPRWVPTALATVLLVVLQCLGLAGGLSPSAHATAGTAEPVAYTACGDGAPPGAESAPEHIRVRPRPHTCPVTDGHVAPAAPTPQDVPEPSCHPRVVAYDESRPAGSELPSLLQVFRC
ncbi:hypothetical protein [Streptomyces lasiicapitis]|uniref:Secreted protein n=1 Tax=Streptomyces lasiicapitis TaxID=1923961 RepID=A0ABQ2LJ94_9ACTN|nr:hypothetical protein [Streptomyces lasiicapitis]GGO36876.1 hypothetical protein GCM10012286_09560 [Streptomyces lasiicapitis]